MCIDPDLDHVTANVAVRGVDRVTDTADRDHVIVTGDRAADHVTSTDVVRGVAVVAAQARAPLTDATEVTVASPSNGPSLRVCIQLWLFIAVD